MPFEIVRNDITKMAVDAVVNPTDPNFSGSGGTDSAIHRAAGVRLRMACRSLKRLGVGECKLTKGYNLPCKYIIHTVGPRWKDGASGEAILLKECCLGALRLAAETGCESVALPLIASGSFGYPKKLALKVTMEAISAFLQEKDIKVYLVVYDKKSYAISAELFCDITAYIDENYISVYEPCASKSLPLMPMMGRAEKEKQSMPCQMPSVKQNDEAGAAPKQERPLYAKQPTPRRASFDRQNREVLEASEQELEQRLMVIDESFSEMLLRKIDEKGMTDVQCYKKANIDRKLFSKIRGDKQYRPSKLTAIAFAVALELTESETKEMLLKAGYALSRSNKFDIIIEYFISKGNYNIYDINEALFAFDQSLLGA